MDYGKRKKKNTPDKLTAQLLILIIFEFGGAFTVAHFQRVVPVSERTLLRYIHEWNVLLGGRYFRYRKGLMPSVYANRCLQADTGSWSLEDTKLIPRKQVPEKLLHLWRLAALYRKFFPFAWLYPDATEENEDDAVHLPAAQFVDFLKKHNITVTLRTAQRDRKILRTACELFQDFKEE